MREINQLAKDGKNDEVIAKGRAIEGLYPDYVEAGNVYSFVADACLKKDDKACAMEELGRYSKIGGRDPETIKKYAKLLAGAGKAKGSGSGAGALELYLSGGCGTARTARAICCSRPATPPARCGISGADRDASHRQAGSHYNLAKAFKAAGQKDQAREEAVSALEAAPNFKPAQKLLLEVSGDEKREGEK